MSDEAFIRRTFELARRGLGTTWPNPLVGAVIVKNDQIISEGFHIRPGGPHAELAAIEAARESLEGSTLYVNLEPCSHTNKLTPPCAQRLIKEGIRKVVISNLDPNPQVNGQGIALLRAQGVEVVHGILAPEGEKLNEVFFLAQRERRPFLNLKVAATLDGKMALGSGESQWITGPEARAHVHQLRAQHQAILVGGGTLRRDNPRLTVRTPEYAGVQPWRIVVSRSGQLNVSASLFQDAHRDRTLVYTEAPLSFSFPGAQVTRVRNLRDVVEDLFRRRIICVMLECGPSLSSELLKERLLDRLTLYQSPTLIGRGQGMLDHFSIDKLSQRPRLTEIETRWIGEDQLITGRVLCSQD